MRRSREQSTVTDLTRGGYRRVYDQGYLYGRRINSVSPIAEFAFTRLILLADDFGNLEGALDMIAAKAFPLRRDVTEAQIGEWVDELKRAGLVDPYVADGRGWLHIANFEAMQPARGAHRKRVAKCPAHDGASRRMNAHEGASRRTLEHEGASERKKCGESDQDQDQDQYQNQDQDQEAAVSEPEPFTREAAPVPPPPEIEEPLPAKQAFNHRSTAPAHTGIPNLSPTAWGRMRAHAEASLRAALPYGDMPDCPSGSATKINAVARRLGAMPVETEGLWVNWIDALAENAETNLCAMLGPQKPMGRLWERYAEDMPAVQAEKFIPPHRRLTGGSRASPPKRDTGPWPGDPGFYDQPPIEASEETTEENAHV